MNAALTTFSIMKKNVPVVAGNWEVGEEVEQKSSTEAWDRRKIKLHVKTEALLKDYKVSSQVSFL